MANWSTNINLDGMDSDFLAIRSLFESGHIKKMKQLEEQAPTKMAKLLGLHYNSYLDKLNGPEKFSVKHINTIAYACRLDPTIIFDVIQNEIKTMIKEGVDKFLKK